MSRFRAGRAIMLAGEEDTLDTYYYILQGLDRVIGLITKNGILAENRGAGQSPRLGSGS